MLLVGFLQFHFSSCFSIIDLGAALNHFSSQPTVQNKFVEIKWDIFKNINVEMKLELFDFFLNG